MSDASYLYQQIAASIRQDILTGKLQPGDRLPSVREMTKYWDCTIGTIQRAYHELVEAGLVVSRPGQGTHVATSPAVQDATPLRKAALIHRAEAFLLEVITAGYSTGEVESAVRQALDRWRAVAREMPAAPPGTLRFAGSHDLAITWLASRFSDLAPGYTLQLQFSGSRGGLIALAEGQADLAGCHLWDADSDEYNFPFVRRMLPGQRVALLTLAHRRLGLILPPGNPAQIKGLTDLAQPGLRFANRQAGSGTRVWLDAQLHQAGLDPHSIPGYHTELLTHSQIAQAVAEDQANAGIGLEAAATAFGLDFLPLTLERYDLAIPVENWDQPGIQGLYHWLSQPAARKEIVTLGGYDTHATGQVRWVE